MAWMKIDLELPDKPEVHAIAGMLNADPNAVVGMLIRVWQWFDKHTTDGNAFGVTYTLADRISGVTGFGEAMAFVGWLEQQDKTLVMPKFDRHTSESAKARALTADRVAKHKAKTNADGNAASVSESLPREREREDKNKAIRKAYTCEKFAEFWKLWPATDRRTNKAKCLDKWKTLGLDEHASEIFPHVAALKLTQKWREGFEPAPLTYLNGRQWEDDLPTVQRQQSTGQTGQARERARVAAQIFGNGSYQENKELDITGFSERVE